ncbi:MAG TPA: MFS transporter [Acetobacteraceae bacterium]|nr:MFS transporter [Acetobacteraceae bacterium]
MADTTSEPTIETDVPARLDRLPWSRFHLLVIIALGITWVLDGLEVTIVGSIGPILKEPATLGFSDQDIGAFATSYLAGAVLGALGFGWLTDRFGRKFIFYVTLATYIVGVLLTAFSWNFWSFALFRFITGCGIGGEYAAINSAIDELMPARLRGRIALIVNGSYWIGTAMGAGGSLLLLSGRFVGVDLGWRLGFAIGGVLGCGIIFLRHWVPESPRWSITHGREREAKRIVEEIEDRVGVHRLDKPTKTLIVHPHRVFGFKAIFGSMFGEYRRRSVVVFVLMATQAFLYNAVFFTYGLILTDFYKVPSNGVGLFILPFAVGNFLGPVFLGHFFDTIGRRKMIAATYTVSGLMLALVGILFANDLLTAWSQTLCWCAIFFVASAAASAAYLTASEVFPLETRALAIAVFYAIGTLIGGVAAPWIFGQLIGTGDAWTLAGGYIFAGVLMVGAAVCAAFLGVDAEGKSLEDIAKPLSSAA